jgi:hypothetical protein
MSTGHFASAVECIESVNTQSVDNWAPGVRQDEIAIAQVHATLAVAFELETVVAEIRALREEVLREVRTFKSEIDI